MECRNKKCPEAREELGFTLESCKSVGILCELFGQRLVSYFTSELGVPRTPHFPFHPYLRVC